MTTAKRKARKPPSQIHSRTTRSRGKALGDPEENTQRLTEQLRELGLYAASTLGDGNCLFRALSDQHYGSDSYHLKLRQEICNWIDKHKTRYEPFVDDERGLAVHLQCMRQPGTYGGHLELSAFAHMMKRNVKVIQPGLVYVIEWNAGGEVKSDESASPAQSRELATQSQEASTEETADKPQTRRERKRLEKERASVLPPSPEPDGDNELGPVYVAYHDWEHFSSIRNLKGPHMGPPNVHETPVPDAEDDPSPSSVKKKPLSARRTVNAKLRAEPRRTRASTRLKEEHEATPLTPTQIPLPISRSPSPTSEESRSVADSPLPYPLPPTPPSPSRIYRSPKRTFDESSASSEGSQSAAKRAKGPYPPIHASRLNPDFDIDTPPLTMSAPGSPSSLSSLSSLSSRESTPPPPVTPEPALTRRQRKKLGLPKPRVATVGGTKASAGKILIPGGRYQRAGHTASQSPPADSVADSEEWRKNGTGRLDVRGFRELRI